MKNSLLKKDTVIAGAITAAFMALALAGLGSFSAPATFWKAAAAGESLTLSLPAVTKVAKALYYWGLGGLGKNSFSLSYGGAPAKVFQTPPANAAYGPTVLAWEETRPDVRADSIKVSFDTAGTSLGALAFIGPDGKPVPGLEIVSVNGNPADKGSAGNLFDETAKIPTAPSMFNSLYFDEIYYARSAAERLAGVTPSNWVHPPLAKALMALGARLAGPTPFGWRFTGVLAGAAMIPLLYALAKKMFGSSFYAASAALLLASDFMLFSQSRIASLDIYLAFFTLTAFYFFYSWYSSAAGSTLTSRAAPLLLCGIALGLGASCKWSAAFPAAGLTSLFIFKAFADTRGDRLGAGFLAEAACLVFAPFITYYLVFGLLSPASAHAFDPAAFLKAHADMYAFHSGLAAKHGYTSPWWTWPITLKPVLFYRNIYLPAGSSSVIYSMGNPALWWAGAAATLACIFYTATEGERAALFIAAAVLSQLLPWAVFSRPAFLYFFFPAVPFYALAAVYAAKRLAAAVPAFKNIFIAYQAAAVMLFAAFYPAISGARVPAAWINGLNWISIWKF